MVAEKNVFDVMSVCLVVVGFLLYFTAGMLSVVYVWSEESEGSGLGSGE